MRIPRKRQGETQTSLAEKLHVNQSTISSLLADRHNPGYPLARALAQLPLIYARA